MYTRKQNLLSSKLDNKMFSKGYWKIDNMLSSLTKKQTKTVIYNQLQFEL